MNILLKSLLATLLISTITNSAVAGVAPTQFSVGVHAQNDRIKSQDSNHHSAYGFNGAFIYNAISQLMFGIDGQLTFGHLNSFKTTTSEVRGVVGYNFFAGATVFTPYTGFGIYSKKFKISGTELTQQFKYLPFGVNVSHNICNDWAVGFRGEYDLVISPKIKLATTIGTATAKGKTGDVNGYKANLDFIKKLSGSARLAFGPYINVWDYSKSPTNVHIVESGLKIALQF